MNKSSRTHNPRPQATGREGIKHFLSPTFILALLFLTLSACGHDDQATDQQDGLDGYTIASGSIAMNPSDHSWIIYEDGIHQVMNMTEILWSTQPGSEGVRVYWGFDASKIVSCTISVDETYALIGLVGGAKIDVDSVIIQFNKTFAEMDDVNGNVFVYCILRR